MTSPPPLISPAPVRILHCSSGNLYGGVETLLATLAREAPPGLRTEYALCFEGRASAELRAAGAPVHLLPPVRFSRPWTVWRARRGLRRLLRERPFDVVICHGCWPLGLFGPIVRREGCRLVFWHHDMPGGRTWVDRLAALTPPDFALAGSRCAAETLPQLFQGVPSAVLHPPIRAANVDRAEARASIRAELTTPVEASVIVQASRLDPWKGQSSLIEALGLLRDRPGWVAWIAGGAQRPHELAYLAELRARVQALEIADRIWFLGHRSDVPRLFAAADILCQPNLRPESFGLTFVEAMNAGLPVVTTRLGAAIELVDPSCGILVPPADPPALAESLATLLDDPETRMRLATAGPPRAHALCDPGAVMERFEALLRHGAHADR